ncbi:MAG: hypothetical protein M1524_03395 [Patescibacteria group bacterium]|nr:hypothetical protein [Patescibacteria group bacterium]
MNNIEMCSNCRISGKCWFKEEADKAVVGVGKNGEGAEEAHVKIADLRNIARDTHNCPNVNTVNPSYPGRENL